MKRLFIFLLIFNITFIKTADYAKSCMPGALLQESETNRKLMIKYLDLKSKSLDEAEDYFILLPNDSIKSYLFFIKTEKCVSIAKEIYDSLSDKCKNAQSDKVWFLINV